MKALCYKKRLRIRNQIFKDSEIGQSLLEKIKSTYGVLKVKFNHRVGSLLVIFDSLKTDIETILEQIANYAETNLPKGFIIGKPKGNIRRNARLLVKLGLITSIGGTIGALTISGKTHVLAGSVFLGLLAIHGFQHRRTFLK